MINVSNGVGQKQEITNPSPNATAYCALQKHGTRNMTTVLIIKTEWAISQF